MKRDFGLEMQDSLEDGSPITFGDMLQKQMMDNGNMLNPSDAIKKSRKLANNSNFVQ
jgi:hypothetical protein